MISEFYAGDEVKQADKNAEGLPWYKEEEGNTSSKGGVGSSSVVPVVLSLAIFLLLK